ncbi:MAG: glutamate racemase [Desulfobulbus sp.]|nr:MAG: glutamate racemase [Desulfobulbus sp.]RUM35346.1 MAG: glutamate racemase [Desulfobulbus sp.]RUM41784.1 MAG: glutamate racemase [Desulfobulbus sp.]
MIGIFDSGVGGMTVARAIEHICPGYPLIYFGDIARTPYGSKSPETIIEYSKRNTDFLLNHGATVIVIACNSAASTASDALRSHYTVPVLDVITPATRKAAAVTRNKRIGVIGTRATVRSKVYTKGIQAINADCTVISQACPLLVPLVEEGWLNKRETKMILRRYLHPLKRRQIDTLVLGCTHYPLLSTLIQPRIGKRVQLIDSSVEVARYLKEFLDNTPDINNKLLKQKMDSRFFVSDSTAPVRQLADRIFGRTIHLEKVDA